MWASSCPRAQLGLHPTCTRVKKTAVLALHPGHSSFFPLYVQKELEPYPTLSSARWAHRCSAAALAHLELLDPEAGQRCVCRHRAEQGGLSAPSFFPAHPGGAALQVPSPSSGAFQRVCCPPFCSVEADGQLAFLLVFLAWKPGLPC